MFLKRNVLAVAGGLGFFCSGFLSALLNVLFDFIGDAAEDAFWICCVS